MSDFLTLIRQEHARAEQVKKSVGSGRVIRPPELEDTQPFVSVLQDDLERKRQAEKAYKPIEREVKVVKGRKTDFTDLVTSRASGYHAVRSDLDGFKDDEALSNIVNDFLDALDTISV